MNKLQKRRLHRIGNRSDAFMKSGRHLAALVIAVALGIAGMGLIQETFKLGDGSGAVHGGEPWLWIAAGISLLCGAFAVLYKGFGEKRA